MSTARQVALHAPSRLHRAKARIDVEFRVKPGAGLTRERVRRVIRTATDRVIGKIVAPRRVVAVDVLVTGDDEIRRLNAIHRRIDRATDVLSFPILAPHETCRLWGVVPPRCFLGRCVEPPQNPDPDAPLTPAGGQTGAVHLGDVVISLPRIENQAARRDITVQEELEFVMAHACLHLLGCDHDTPTRRRVMWDYTHLLLWNGSFL